MIEWIKRKESVCAPVFGRIMPANSPLVEIASSKGERQGLLGDGTYYCVAPPNDK